MIFNEKENMIMNGQLLVGSQTLFSNASVIKSESESTLSNLAISGAGKES